jgi:serine/threonine protein kinase
MSEELPAFGKYTIIREIGRGAMGIVYLAADPVLERQVAIKTIASNTSRAEFRQRFIREAKSAARLNHPNIITIHDFGEHNNQLYIVMEYIEGVDLDQLIALGHPIDIKDRIRMVREICSGVFYAHSNGIIHRDLKPSNIKIQPDGHVKILDFGLSVMEDSSLTQSRVILGTPNFIAPERIRGEATDARADQFSIGLILYELISGRCAFHGDTLPTMLFQILNTQPLRLTGDLVERFPAFNRIISRSISKEPGQRFMTLADMEAALEDLHRQLLQSGICNPNVQPLSDSRYGEGDFGSVEPSLPSVTQVIPVSGSPNRSRWLFGLIIILLPALIWLGTRLFSPVPDLPSQQETIEERGGGGLLLLDALPYLTVTRLVSLPDMQLVHADGLVGAMTPLRLELPAGQYRLEGTCGGEGLPVAFELTIVEGETLHKNWISDPQIINRALDQLSGPENME